MTPSRGPRPVRLGSDLEELLDKGLDLAGIAFNGLANQAIGKRYFGDDIEADVAERLAVKWSLRLASEERPLQFEDLTKLLMVTLQRQRQAISDLADIVHGDLNIDTLAPVMQFLGFDFVFLAALSGEDNRKPFVRFSATYRAQGGSVGFEPPSLERAHAFIDDVRTRLIPEEEPVLGSKAFPKTFRPGVEPLIREGHVQLRCGIPVGVLEIVDAKGLEEITILPNYRRSEENARFTDHKARLCTEFVTRAITPTTPNGEDALPLLWRALDRRRFLDDFDLEHFAQAIGVTLRPAHRNNDSQKFDPNVGPRTYDSVRLDFDIFLEWCKQEGMFSHMDAERKDSFYAHSEMVPGFPMKYTIDPYDNGHDIFVHRTYKEAGPIQTASRGVRALEWLAGCFVMHNPGELEQRYELIKAQLTKRSKT